ncbi:alpha/beta fold hydrolase [Actinoallomurus iriomotensis]|uniref:Hydrolase n=1 Tax=Actinoallomurus iriomotensis TaxID=478107 RepID=A0A9W6RPY1_9ACTN|nr:alpha/beta fold hydrolase [Actinoallomurus iriomotensis]GLY79633.1 hydrolase [Actinoallomurus iriomotensis]
MYAKVRDTELYFDVEGSGLARNGREAHEKPVLFALPGGPGGDQAGLKPMLSPLSDQVQIVSVDHRGSGRSAPGPVETYTMENHVDDVEALRRHLGLGKIALLGISYGGMVAQTYATRYPENLSHLLLVVTAPDHRFLKRAQEILAERGTPEQQRTAERLFAGEFESPDQMRHYFEVMGPMYSRTFDLEEERSRRFIFTPESINAAYRGYLRDWDVTGDLHRITAPTLVIAARHDWICAPEFSVEIAQRIPGAELRMFENSGHNVNADEYDAFIDVLRGFIPYPPRHDHLAERV